MADNTPITKRPALMAVLGLGVILTLVAVVFVYLKVDDGPLGPQSGDSKNSDGSGKGDGKGDGKKGQPIEKPVEGPDADVTPTVDEFSYDATGLEEATKKAIDRVPVEYDNGCHLNQVKTDPKDCLTGDKNGDITVAAVGDSKMLQWLPGLQEAAKDQGWKLKSYTKSGCAWTSALVSNPDGPYTGCQQWGKKIRDILTGDGKPDAVIVSSMSSNAFPGDGTSNTASVGALVDGYVEYWNTLTDAGVKVIVLADSPRPKNNVPECLQKYDMDASKCATPYKKGPGTDTLERAVKKAKDVTLVSMDDWICPGEKTCPAVIDDNIVYRDQSHLAVKFTQFVSKPLGERIQDAIDKG